MLLLTDNVIPIDENNRIPRVAIPSLSCMLSILMLSIVPVIFLSGCVFNCMAEKVINEIIWRIIILAESDISSAERRRAERGNDISITAGIILDAEANDLPDNTIGTIVILKAAEIINRKDGSA